MPARIALMLTVVLTLLVVAWASAQEQEHPIAAQVKSSLKDPTQPFTMLVHLRVKEGSGPKLEAAFAKAAKQTRKEKGNKAYEMSRSTKAPAEYVIYERWQNLASLESHLKAPYIDALLGEVGGLLEGQPELKVLVPVGD